MNRAVKNSPWSATGVVAAVDSFKAFSAYMRVDLGGGDVGMAQHDLYGPQIGAALQEVAGEGVPDGVRADVVLDAR